MHRANEGQSPEPLEADSNFSYLLRAWREESDPRSEKHRWRYSLRDLKTRAQRGFADLESLVAYFHGIERDSGWQGDDQEISQRKK